MSLIANSDNHLAFRLRNLLAYHSSIIISSISLDGEEKERKELFGVYIMRQQQ